MKMEEQMTTFELLNSYRNIEANRLSEIYHYQGVKGKVGELQAYFSNLEGYKKVNPNDLTKDQLMKLGGAIWSKKSKLVLLPLWMVKHLLPFKGATISQPDLEKDIDLVEQDLDNRGGCVSFGVLK